MAASSSRPPQRMSIESGAFTFHYLIEGDVVYLTLAERAYPKKLAFQYLEELQSEFSRLYGGQIEAVTRPYAFIKFGAQPPPGGRARWWRTRPAQLLRYGAVAPVHDGHTSGETLTAHVCCRTVAPARRHLHPED